MFDGFYKKIKLFENVPKTFISHLLVYFDREFITHDKYIYKCNEIPEKSKCNFD